MYELGMRKESSESTERLIRVNTLRRGAPVEIRVHYEINRASASDTRVSGCDIIRLFSVEDSD